MTFQKVMTYMIFHIIFTLDSVKYLIHFIPSLLKKSSYQFCLVSNGCSQKERAMLRMLANKHNNLSYYCYPTNQMQIHGKVLSHLQARCQEEYFCFMDSDIFATAPLPNLENIMKTKNLTGLFSAMPLWVKKSEFIFKPHFKSMIGTFNQLENGRCIGSTYFSIYRNDHLNQIIQHYGVCFDECKRAVLPLDIQEALQNKGFDQTNFDTAKVINLLLNKHQFILKNLDIPALCHIGGTSYETTYQQQPLNLKRNIRNILKKSALKKIVDQYRFYSFNKRFKDYTEEEFQLNYNQRISHRDHTRQHFLKLYQALVNNTTLPKVPIFKEEEISRNITIAHNLYIENFNKYYKPY